MSIRQTFTDIANAIREKTGNTGLLYPSEMAQNILDIPQGGGEDNLPAFLDGTANFEDYASSIRNLSVIRPYTFMSDTTVINANFPKVEKIGECAFSSCTNLQTASFPKCSQLGGSAFRGCNNLETINFPKCSKIGNDAFLGCSKITEASFPEALSIASYCFNSCYSLTTAYFPKASLIDISAFFNCSNLTSVYAPMVEELGGSAFVNCSKLSDVNFPLTKVIGNRYMGAVFASTAIKSASFPKASYICGSAFANCKSLTTVNLDNVYNMGTAVFLGCTSLETVTLGAYSYSSIANPSRLFSGCTNLKSIYVPSGALNYYQTSSWWSYWSDKIVPYDESDEYIYPYEYANNTTITEIPLSKQNVTEVRYNAFLGCTNLKSVNLPNCGSYYEDMLSGHLNNIEYLNIGVSWFKSFALGYMYSLKEVYAPRLTSIESYDVFYNTTKLRIVSLPLLEMLPADTFRYKTELEYVNLENCKSIILGAGAFSGCSKLEYVNLPNCRSIGNYTFNGCSNLRSVNLDSVEKITQGMFEGVYSLAGINLPACKTFEDRAFKYCYGLKTVSAPNLESWGAGAFESCPLESVYIGSNVTYVGGDCIPPDGSTKIYVPNDMVDTYKNGVFSWYSSRIYGY